VLLAIHYFAPGVARRGLFKWIESSDRERALAGIRNAAWDLTLLSEWLRHIQRQQESGTDRPLVILASFDDWVKRLARAIVHYEDPAMPDIEYQTRIFQRVWDPAIATRLATLLSQLQAAAGEPKRQLHREVSPDFIDCLIKDGEAKILEWKSRRA
jgi:hypothetical protein